MEATGQQQPQQQAMPGGRQPPRQQEQLTRPESSSSPYVQCGSTEDYKLQGYGASGHREPVENSRGAGTTEGPTLSGGALAELQGRRVN